MEQDATHTKAMVEVALALAMGFFSIMVLAMVSMGAGVDVKPVQVGLLPGISVATSSPNKPTPNDSNSPITQVKQANLIIFHNGQFLSADLRPIDLETWRETRRKPILAVAPGLDFESVMKARNDIGSDNVIVTSLDDRWLARLRELDQITGRSKVEVE